MAVIPPLSTRSSPTRTSHAGRRGGTRRAGGWRTFAQSGLDLGPPTGAIVRPWRRIVGGRMLMVSCLWPTVASSILEAPLSSQLLPAMLAAAAARCATGISADDLWSTSADARQDPPHCSDTVLSCREVFGCALIILVKDVDGFTLRIRNDPGAERHPRDRHRRADRAEAANSADRAGGGWRAIARPAGTQHPDQRLVPVGSF